MRHFFKTLKKLFSELSAKNFAAWLERTFVPVKRLDPRDHLHLPFHPHCKCDLGVLEMDTVELGYQGGTVGPRQFTDIPFPEPKIDVEYVEPITLLGKRIGTVLRLPNGRTLTGDIDGFGETIRGVFEETVGEDVKFSVRSESPEPSDEIEVEEIEYKSCDVTVADDGKAIDSVRLTGVLHRGALEEQVNCLKMAHVKLNECDWADEPARTVTGIIERPQITQLQIDLRKRETVSGFVEAMNALEKASTAVPPLETYFQLPSLENYRKGQYPIDDFLSGKRPMEDLQLRPPLNTGGVFRTIPPSEEESDK